MNPSLQLLLMIGEISDHHIQHAEAPTKSPVYRWITPLIAAACAVIVLIAILPVLTHNKTSDSSPDNIFLSAQRPAPQTFSLEELIARADCIILGTVVAEQRVESLGPQTTFVSSNPLMSVPNIDSAYEHTVTVDITDTLKGDVHVGNRLDISNNAHDAYDKNGCFLGTVYLGDATLMKSGDRVLLFLEHSLTDTNQYKLIGEGSKWFLINDNIYRCGVCFDTRFPNTFTPRIGLTDYSPISLEQLKSIIEE